MEASVQVPTLSELMAEVDAMIPNDTLDPRGLARRCRQVYDLTVGSVQREIMDAWGVASSRIQRPVYSDQFQVYASGQWLEKAELSSTQLEAISKWQSRSYFGSLLLKANRVAALTLGFLVAFAFERLIRVHFLHLPPTSGSLVVDLLWAGLVYIFYGAAAADFVDSVGKTLDWSLLEAERAALLEDLRSMKALCGMGIKRANEWLDCELAGIEGDQYC